MDGRFSDDIIASNLPRAVIDEDRPKTYKRFLTRFPAHPRAAEIQALYATHMFKRAKNSGTVTAFRTFIKDFPKASEIESAQKELDALYERAESRFVSQAARKNPELVDFFSRLLAHQKSKEIAMLPLYFVPPSAAELETLDTDAAAMAPESIDDLIGKAELAILLQRD